MIGRFVFDDMIDGIDAVRCLPEFDALEDLDGIVEGVLDVSDRSLVEKWNFGRIDLEFFRGGAAAGTAQQRPVPGQRRRISREFCDAFEFFDGLPEGFLRVGIDEEHTVLALQVFGQF